MRTPGGKLTRALIYGMKEVFRIAEGRDKIAHGALIAGIAGIRGAIKAKLFGRSEEERRRRAWGA